MAQALVRTPSCARNSSLNIDDIVSLAGAEALPAHGEAVQARFADLTTTTPEGS